MEIKITTSHGNTYTIDLEDNIWAILECRSDDGSMHNEFLKAMGPEDFREVTEVIDRELEDMNKE